MYVCMYDIVYVCMYVCMYVCTKGRLGCVSEDGLCLGAGLLGQPSLKSVGEFRCAVED